MAALAVLGGLGYLLARQTNPPGPYPTKALGSNPIARPAIQRKEGFRGNHVAHTSSAGEGFLGNSGSSASSASNGRAKEGFSNPTSPTAPPTSLRGSNPQLDIHYTNDPSEPNPSDMIWTMAKPVSQPVASATPQVRMLPAGVEAPSDYADASVTSSLSGQTISAADFNHNNMQPFFGSRVRQNVDPNANTNYLDKYTGAQTLQIRKTEIEPMFDTTQTPFGNVYGMENSSDFVQSRVNDPRNRAGERPFEPIKVAAGVGEGFSSTGKGGFQQIEVNELMMKSLPRTDDLRTTNNPKLSYYTPVVPGQQFIGKSSEDVGEVRKYRPDAFFINQDAERFGPAGQSENTKGQSRPIQIMPHVNRPETSVAYTGSGASQDFGMNYVVGSYKAPAHTQFGGAGFRNADGSGYTDVRDDHGAASYEIRPNERAFTSERGMGLNLTPAEAGAVTTHFEDESRPTRRSEIVGAANQFANATGYANGAPAITVWDPNDIARTTVREGTIRLDRYGIAGPADGPGKAKVYDPDDIARPTQKAQISAKSAYTGGAKAAHQRFMSHGAAYNMRLNPSKQQIARGRKPAGGNIQLFNGEEANVTYKKLDTDSINDRAPAINRSLDLGPGSADIGRVQYRVPLKLDVATQRNQREIISAVEGNPLMQSLHVNAAL